MLNGINNDSYHVVNGLGSARHKKHPNMKPEEAIFPPRRMEQIYKAIVSDLVQANSILGFITNVIFERSGKMYTRKNMAYLTGLCNKLKALIG